MKKHVAILNRNSLTFQKLRIALCYNKQKAT